MNEGGCEMRFLRAIVLVTTVASWVSIFTLKNSHAQETGYAEAEAKIIRLTNDLRTSGGLKELTVSEPLRKASVEFARFMLTEGKYGHQADGRRPAQRAEAAGYDYCVVSENIAYIV